MTDVWTQPEVMLMLIGISYVIISLFPQISSTSVLSLFSLPTVCTAQPVNDAQVGVGQLLCAAGNRTGSPEDSKRPDAGRRLSAASCRGATLRFNAIKASVRLRFAAGNLLSACSGMSKLVRWDVVSMLVWGQRHLSRTDKPSSLRSLRFPRWNLTSRCSLWFTALRTLRCSIKRPQFTFDDSW